MRVLHARACIVAHLESHPESPDFAFALQKLLGQSWACRSLWEACDAGQTGAAVGVRVLRRRVQSKDSPIVNADFLIAAHHQATAQLKPLCLHAWRMDYVGKTQISTSSEGLKISRVITLIT